MTTPNPMDALKPERGLTANPETLQAAQMVLNRLYEADHQTLFELVKLMAIETASIVRHAQGGEIEFADALVDGMQWAESLIAKAEAQAVHGYRPMPIDVWKPEEAA